MLGTVNNLNNWFSMHYCFVKAFKSYKKILQICVRSFVNSHPDDYFPYSTVFLYSSISLLWPLGPSRKQTEKEGSKSEERVFQLFDISTIHRDVTG